MFRVRLILVIVLFTGIFVLPGLGTKSSQGAEYESTPMPRPTITPIPRPTLPTDSSTRQDVEGSQSSARIVLQWESEPITATLSTVVQWQDTGGNWHNIDGWKGQFDNQHQVRWWVAPQHFRTGPYQWVIFSDSDDADKILWVSDPFYLPDSGQTLVVPVSTPLSR